MAAIGQLLDIVLANGKIPLEIKSTPMPEGAADEVFVGPPGIDKVLGQAYGYKGDGKDYIHCSQSANRGCRSAHPQEAL